MLTTSATGHRKCSLYTCAREERVASLHALHGISAVVALRLAGSAYAFPCGANIDSSVHVAEVAANDHQTKTTYVYAFLAICFIQM